MLTNINVKNSAWFLNNVKQTKPKLSVGSHTSSGEGLADDKLEISLEAREIRNMMLAKLKPVELSESQTKSFENALEITESLKKPEYDSYADEKSEVNNDKEKSDIISYSNDEVEDATITEARRKLTAMKIAQRIAKGDNVPMQDHRFLAEFDSALYKASLKASLTANNDEPETHESLADELLAIENATRNPGNQATSESEESEDIENIDTQETDDI